MAATSGAGTNCPYLLLTLVRHGETKENKTRIIQGQSDTVLNDEGINQAQLAGSKLCDEEFSHIFSSDLQRARKTAEEIVKRNHFCSSKQIVEDLRLRERNYGVAEGLSTQEFSQMAANNSMKPSCFTPKGAETLAEVKKRAIEFLSSFLHEIGSLHFDLNSHVQNDSCATNEIVNDSQTSEHKVLEGQKQSHLANALVVSHGGVIRQLLLYFLEDLASEFPSGSNRKVRFVSPNTGVSKFRIFINEQTKLPEFVECICLHNAEHLSKSE